MLIERKPYIPPPAYLLCLPDDRQALFPVIATCMKFTQQEVDEIRSDRERRQSGVRALF